MTGAAAAGGAVRAGDGAGAGAVAQPARLSIVEKMRRTGVGEKMRFIGRTGTGLAGSVANNRWKAGLSR